MKIKLYKRSGSSYYWMKFTVDGVLHRESTKTDNKKIAQGIADKREEDILLGKGVISGTKITLEQLIKTVKTDYELNGMKSTHKIELRAKNLFDYYGKGKKVISITTDEITKYIEHRTKEGKKPSTINRENAIVRRGFNLLLRHGKLKMKPIVPMLKERNVRTDFYRHQEYEKLLQNCEPYIRPVIQILYLSGWRINEVLSLQWSMVDVEKCLITLPVGTTKNDQGRKLYMDSELCDTVRRLHFERKQRKDAGEKVSEFVFLNKKGTDRIKDFRGAWGKSCEDAEIGKRLVHSFRRSAARNLIRSGVSEQVAMAILGHKTPSIFRRYNITADDDVKDGMQKQRVYLDTLAKETKQENGVPLWELRIAQDKLNEISQKEEDVQQEAEVSKFLEVEKNLTGEEREDIDRYLKEGNKPSE